MKYLRSNVVCEAYVSISYPFLCTNSKPDADLCRKLAQYFGLIKKKNIGMYMIIFFELFKTILPLVFAVHFASV